MQIFYISSFGVVVFQVFFFNSGALLAILVQMRQGIVFMNRSDFTKQVKFRRHIGQNYNK